MKLILLIFTCICCSVYSQNPKTHNAPAQDLSCQKTDAEWKAQLDDNAYYVWDGDDLFYLAHPDQNDDNY